ncbi:peptide chain release factor N(5)-glutamine methyltransferase [Humidesulfovibrio sp.]
MSGDRPATLSDAVTLAERTLATTGVDSPRLSAELLAAKAFGLSRLGLIMQAKESPDEAALVEFNALVARRAQGEPAAYILGDKEFFGLNFRVTPDVLIPRPETELVVEAAQRFFQPEAAFRFADFGTGSGALAVALTHEFTAAQGLAIDISPPALSIARQNAQLNGVADRLSFLHADFTRLALAPACLDLAVSNPPYVTEAEYAELSPEVRSFEPRSALVSPEAGLWHLRLLLPVATRALRAGGLFLCELGSGQGPAALALVAEQSGFLVNSSILKDYAGLDRILMAVRSSQKCSK